MLRIFNGDRIFLFPISQSTSFGSSGVFYDDTNTRFYFLCGILLSNVPQASSFDTFQSFDFEPSHTDQVPQRYNNLRQLAPRGMIIPLKYPPTRYTMPAGYAGPYTSYKVINIPSLTYSWQLVLSGQCKYWIDRWGRKEPHTYYWRIFMRREWALDGQGWIITVFSLCGDETSRPPYFEACSWLVREDAEYNTQSVYSFEHGSWTIKSFPDLLEHTAEILYDLDLARNRNPFTKFRRLRTISPTDEKFFPKVSSSWSVPNDLSNFDIGIEPNWSELAAKTYADCEFGFGSNGIAYAKDMIELSAAAKSTANAVKSVMKKGRAMKAVADLFLSFFYGWRLMVADTKELTTFLDSLGLNVPNRRSAAQVQMLAQGGKRQDIYAVYLLPFQGLRSGLNDLSRIFDLDLDLNNIWDMIPWSFVIDWFVSVGDLADTLTGWMDLQYVHKVLCSCRTTIIQLPLSPEQLGSPYYGLAELRYYSRQFNSRPEEPSFLIHVNGSEPMNHWVEGSALILSKF